MAPAGDASTMAFGSSPSPLDEPRPIYMLGNGYLMVPDRTVSKRASSQPSLDFPPTGKILGLIPRGKTGCRIGAVMILLASFVVAVFFDQAVNAVLEWQMQLSPHNFFTWFAWLELPIQLRIQAFLFGISNPDQFLRGAKPHLVEHGPYVMDISRTRTVIRWTNQTVIFTERFGVRFQPEQSQSLDEPVQSVNPVIVCAIGSIRYYLRRYNVQFIDPLVNNVVVSALRLSGELIISHNTAGELLFGREVPMLAFLDRLSEPLRMWGIDLALPLTKFGDYKVSNNTFGLFSILQSSTFGPLEHFRRHGPGHRANEVYRIEGKTTNENYQAPCNKIRGLDPLIFGVNLKPGEPIQIYVHQFCRGFTMIYDKAHYVKGIWSLRYSFWPHTYDQSYPENHCYCWGERSLAQCDGYTDVSACLSGIPIGMSFSHFYQSPLLQSRVVGQPPDPAEDINYLDIEPNIGVPVNAHMAFQINIIHQGAPLVLEMSKIPPSVVPFLRLKVEVAVEMPLWPLMFLLSVLLNWGKWLLLASLWWIAASLWYRHRRQDKIHDCFRRTIKTVKKEHASLKALALTLIRGRGAVSRRNHQ